MTRTKTSNALLSRQGFSRRQFLRGGAATVGAGLLIGFNIGCTSDNPDADVPIPDEPLVPNAFVRIAPDNTVTIYAKHFEAGQGAFTGLATVLAEELDASWDQVRVEAAPADNSKYYHVFIPELPDIGRVQLTGGSSAMANSWQQMREAGAAARAMLVAAAAAEWKVSADSISVDDGVVSHSASGQSASFGALAGRASTLELPTAITLKDPGAFKLIGKEVSRVDVDAKTDGTAQYTIDVYMPEMLTAVIARPPLFGSTVSGFDASQAKAVPGVVDVVEIPSGVAVLADGYWPARMGQKALSVEWDDSGAEKRSTAQLFDEYRALANEPGVVAHLQGEPERALAEAAQVFEAEFEFPYLAHAPMETLDCVIQRQGDTCQVWAGSQSPTLDQAGVADILGLERSKVQVHTQLAGGSFGRRVTGALDLTSEAAAIVKSTGSSRPIKVIWSREDDIRGGHYRPMYVHRVRAGIDGSGDIVAWEHRIVGQSVAVGAFFDAIAGDPDISTAEGARELPYDIANVLVDVHNTDVGVPVVWWRSVGHSYNAFVVECAIDELAELTGRDPFAMRQSLLAAHPRHLAVLQLAAEKADWGSPLPAGKARGIAVHASFGSFVAQVAEVSLQDDGLPRVERVVCAVDCGIAINPDNVRSQIEGGLGFGLGAALHNEITLEGGRVMQSNFHDYQPLRIYDMPQVEVHIVPSAEAPTGVGEPGLPPIAPAVVNAYRQLIGQPVRRLPLRSTLG